MAKQKKLQKDSKHNEMDLDGDGIVSDSELAASVVLTQPFRAILHRPSGRDRLVYGHDRLHG